MKRMFISGLSCVAVLAAGWLAGCSRSSAAEEHARTIGDTHVKTEEAIFAGGCFWGTEAAFRKVNGVVATEVGYCGGHTSNPTYKDVCTETTGYAESVKVTFDPMKVSYPELLDAFWTAHDPTTMDRQGPDIGSQYRSVIFYENPTQEQLAKASAKEVQDSGVFGKRKIVTEIIPASRFYRAEEYHQEYFEKQGTASTCHTGVAVVHTKLAAEYAASRKSAATQPASCNVNNPESCGTSHWTAMTDAEMRAKLTPEEYNIARQAGTERAFTGKYWDDHRPGVYVCAVCGQPLFNADTKFESGTGWPSFYQPITPGAVIERPDGSGFMKRTEVICSRCKSHLGHVFDDGPKPTGLRFCMNSAVLNLHVGETTAQALAADAKAMTADAEPVKASR